MQYRIRGMLVVGFIFTLVIAAWPAAQVEALPAAKQITITITEAQFNRYLPGVRPRGVTKIEADIVDGGIIVKMKTNDPFLPEYWEHYGVLIRDGKVVTEAGVLSFPGIGGLGYAEARAEFPEIIPVLDHNAKIMNKFVQRQISAKAGTRFTPESVATGGDQVVIVVNK